MYEYILPSFVRTGFKENTDDIITQQEQIWILLIIEYENFLQVWEDT